jgi:hypothetical protein
MIKKKFLRCCSIANITFSFVASALFAYCAMFLSALPAQYFGILGRFYCFGG